MTIELQKTESAKTKALAAAVKASATAAVSSSSAVVTDGSAVTALLAACAQEVVGENVEMPTMPFVPQNGTVRDDDSDKNLLTALCEVPTAAPMMLGECAVIHGSSDFVAVKLEKLDAVIGEFQQNNTNECNNVSLGVESKVASTVEIADTVEDFADVTDLQLLYSTLAGVKLVVQPPILKAVLHEHQIQGISWMVHMFQNGMPMILGDQMGLGKTIQSIGFLAYLHHTLRKRGPHLIVVPLSVLSNWMSEIELFCPSLRAVRFHGPKPERERIKLEELADLNEFDIVVTTYEVMVSEVNYFRRKYVWTTIIVDEGHRLKNERSQLSEKIRMVACLGKVILTGTPLQNNLKELWAMLYFLAPDVFTSSKPFEEGFDLLRGHIDTAVLRRARKLLSIFMLRRVKDNVAIRLPNRKELTMLVPLTEQQILLYKALLTGLDADMLNSIMNAAGSSSTEEGTVALTSTTVTAASVSTDSEWRRLMNLLVQLRKICNHTYLMPDIAPDPYCLDERLVCGSGKLQMLDRMLPLLKTNGHRVLIFSQFTSMLDILEDYCELREYQFVRLDGETNRVKRRLDVRRFNAPGSPLFIFLISTRAGGLGLNLASADTVILYDSDWNPQVDLQAMERAHRIGQTKPVRVFRLVCQGSVEERMVNRAEKKLFLNAMVAEADPDEALQELHEDAGGEANESDQLLAKLALGVGGSSMSKSELASLIRFGANAVCNAGSDNNGNGSGSTGMSDSDLAVFLEMEGRDQSLMKMHDEVLRDLSFEKKQQQQINTAQDKLVQSISISNHASSDTAPINDAFELAQKALRDRMAMLKEVDLRQLGGTVYEDSRGKNDTRKRRKGTAEEINSEKEAAALDLLNQPSAKRMRKERIVMLSGKGTGYGGMVPVLANTIEVSATNDNAEETDRRRQGRVWEHMCFCALCGRAVQQQPVTPSIVTAPPVQDSASKKKSKHDDRDKVTPSTSVSSKSANKSGNKSSQPPVSDLAAPSDAAATVMRCAHCPWSFHTECARAFGVLSRSGVGSGMSSCPHHRCVLCSRGTQAAGGLLFRCTGCLTAYCEDCLPQDEIDGVGRCRALEERCGYSSKQSYYIKCPSCCVREGCTPLGVLSSVTSVKRAPVHKSASTDSLPIVNAAAGVDSTIAADDDTGAAAAAVDEADVGQDIVEDDDQLQQQQDAMPDETFVPLKTQLMRIHWTEILPTPPPSPAFQSPLTKKKRQKELKAKSRKGAFGKKIVVEDISDDGEVSEEEAGSVHEQEKREMTAAELELQQLEQNSRAVVIPARCSPKKALELCLGHPVLQALYARVLVPPVIISTVGGLLRNSSVFESVSAKIQQGNFWCCYGHIYIIFTFSEFQLMSLLLS
jgi:superfamily II DNA or RNA helicase